MEMNTREIRTPGEVASWCEAFENVCRQRGIRVTAQRLAVYRALAEDTSHPSVESVHARVRATLPMVSQATVYRILESLEQEQLVRRVSTLAAMARFDANVAPHQHLVCRICGRMTDHFGPAFAAAPPHIDGFVVEELDIRLVGTCESCRSDSSRSDRATSRSDAGGAPSERRTTRGGMRSGRRRRPRPSGSKRSASESSTAPRKE
jgi:Fe2+ or Zn2+ uptake regulation protein